jgi:predicted acylesterase/phospholipase RssA
MAEQRVARSTNSTRPNRPNPVDLVLSGGGVKGVGLVGAVVAVMDAGYSVKRVSGVSAGSLVGSILAAASNGDQLTSAQIKELALTLPYDKFRDSEPSAGCPSSARRGGCYGKTASTAATSPTTGSAAS